MEFLEQLFVVGYAPGVVPHHGKAKPLIAGQCRIEIRSREVGRLWRQRSGIRVRRIFGIVNGMLVLVERKQRLVGMVLVEYGGDSRGTTRQDRGVRLGSFEDGFRKIAGELAPAGHCALSSRKAAAEKESGGSENGREGVNEFVGYNACARGYTAAWSATNEATEISPLRLRREPLGWLRGCSRPQHRRGTQSLLPGRLVARRWWWAGWPRRTRRRDMIAPGAAKRRSDPG